MNIAEPANIAMDNLEHRLFWFIDDDWFVIWMRRVLRETEKQVEHAHNPEWLLHITHSEIHSVWDIREKHIDESFILPSYSLVCIDERVNLLFAYMARNSVGKPYLFGAGFVWNIWQRCYRTITRSNTKHRQSDIGLTVLRKHAYHRQIGSAHSSTMGPVGSILKMI